MSAQSHADHDEHAGHDDEHADEHVDELDSDEPRTPGWLSLLGCALFLAAGIYVIATDEGPKNLVKPEAAVAEAPAAEAPQAATAQVAQPSAPPNPGQQVDPQQARAAAQKLIDQLRLRGAPGGPGAPGGAAVPGSGQGRGRGDGSGRGTGRGPAAGHGPGDGHGH
ncbi:MAG: hypothetical protein H6718_32615 [Polyangiaceae bacterium]|nr:hypothetical protein [Myxococcales bacterium]MCB9590202.1 hypothetical protein [Polyangiaceae bacterium]MCB9608081.1 hypothetical protein [Polyangiaceae bacterium]